MSHERLAATFDEWARAGRDAGMERGHSDVVLQVIERMGIRPGDRVLDLGCGNGWATRLLAKAAAGVQAVGIDVSPAMIERAEELHSLTIRARYEASSFEELDFPEGHFQRAFSMEAVYYAVDLGKALSELHRVLAPGGRADVVVDFYKERPDTAAWAEKVGVPMHWLGEDEWARAFRGAGFADVETERVVDSRGPGDEASFEPSEWYPTWADRVASHAAGSLWIRATRP